MIWLWLSGVAAITGVQAQVQSQPTVAPPSSWVSPIAFPLDTSKDDGRPIKVLLQDQQINFEPDGSTEIYVETVARVQTSEGLAEAGSIGVSWNPETSRVIINKLDVIRRGKRTDQLAAGKSFTVLRRENNLELAQLDGILTATMQVDGLQVGDELDFAYTVFERDPALHGEQEAAGGGWQAGIERAHLSARWPHGHPIQWQATDDLPSAKIARDGSDDVLSVSLENVPTFTPPKGAPPRFYRARQVAFASVKSWGEVATLMRPLYLKASTIGSSSPLDEEIARIAATTKDPKSRAEAALALVQDKIRYFYVGLNDGGYVPANADVTWSRRFGDCKGKTALLLAVLHGLGLEAVPALVSVTQGDGLDKRQPMIGAFDHVLVKATIGGKTYWLDGTRTGDHRLDNIDVPSFRWALPLAGSDSKLVALVVEPAPRSLQSTTLSIDASAGLYLPAKIHVESQTRGDAAYMIKQGFAALPADQRDKMIRDGLKAQYSLLDVTAMSTRYDEETRTETISFDGTVRINWQNYRLRPGGVQFGERNAFEREAGPLLNAPFANPFPVSVENSYTMLLPHNGNGFTVEGGAPFDRVIAGTEYSRRASLAGARFTVEAKARTLAPEISAAEGIAAREPLNAMSNQVVLLGIPKNYRPDATEREAFLALPAKTVSDYITRSWILGEMDRHDQAVTAATSGLQLDPRNGNLLGNRAINYFWLGKYDLAKSDIAVALAESADNAIALRARGAIEVRTGERAAAVTDLTRSLELDPRNGFALVNRALAYLQLENLDRGLEDAMAARAAAPGMFDAHALSATFDRLLGRPQASLADIKTLTDANPKSWGAFLVAGQLYDQLLMRSDAERAYDVSLGLAPKSGTYLARASHAPPGHDGERERDLQAALRLEPKSVEALEGLARLRHGQRRYADSIAFWNRALAFSPDDIEIQASIANEKAAAGDAATSEREYAALRLKAKDHAEDLNALCWAQATAGVASANMLADCDAALALEPADPDILNSRGLALLRLGRDSEALAVYDAALTKEDEPSNSLYGRGVAEARLGKADLATADMNKAMLRNAFVATDFQSYGVMPALAGTPK